MNTSLFCINLNHILLFLLLWKENILVQSKGRKPIISKIFPLSSYKNVWFRMPAIKIRAFFTTKLIAYILITRNCIMLSLCVTKK